MTIFKTVSNIDSLVFRAITINYDFVISKLETPDMDVCFVFSVLFF